MTPLRILIVDDVADFNDAMRLLLESEGHTIATAIDAKAALALCAAFKPDVVLLDLGMPLVGGFEIAQNIRSSGGKPTLIAISGWTSYEDLQRARAAGFDHFLIKPIQLDKLKHLLELVASQSAQPADSEPLHEASRSSPIEQL